MRAQLMPRRSGALALSVLFVLTAGVVGGCGVPQRVGAPLEPIAQTSDPAGGARPTRTATPQPAPAPIKTSKRPSVVNLTCSQTSNQKTVEVALAKIGEYGPVTVDGYQTSADCETIKRFQRRMGIVPANGRANTITTNVAERIAATNPAACGAGTATMACVDLTHQTFFIMKGGTVVLGPTVTRTGMPGWATTSGTFAISERSLTHWSGLFLVWMPYWQRFNSGMGLHETTTYIHIMSIGSHGCVNLLHADAVAAYSLLTYGSKVHTYGRRPGT